MAHRPPDRQLLGFLEPYDRAIADLVLGLREIVLEEAPNALEAIYNVYEVAIWFGFSDKMKDWFCYVMPYTHHVNLGFPHGASLPDPQRVLVGKGKTMRHIKLASESDLARPWVRHYIQAAMQQTGLPADAGSGKSIVKSAGGKANK